MKEIESKLRSYKHERALLNMKQGKDLKQQRDFLNRENLIILRNLQEQRDLDHQRNNSYRKQQYYYRLISKCCKVTMIFICSVIMFAVLIGFFIIFLHYAAKVPIGKWK